jgi:hypothetical protein
MTRTTTGRIMMMRTTRKERTIGAAALNEPCRRKVHLPGVRRVHKRDLSFPTKTSKGIRAKRDLITIQRTKDPSSA